MSAPTLETPSPAAGTATQGRPETAARSARATPAGGESADRSGDSPLLGLVPRPPPGQDTVDLGGALAGGLTARYARWRVDGGEVLLTGAAPFVDLSGRAGVRSDGTLDGTVAMRAAVRLLGLQVAEAEWTVGGWTPDAALAAPAVRLRGTTLSVDLSAIGADVALRTTEGLGTTRSRSRRDHLPARRFGRRGSGAAAPGR